MKTHGEGWKHGQSARRKVLITRPDYNLSAPAIVVFVLVADRIDSGGRARFNALGPRFI